MGRFLWAALRPLGTNWDLVIDIGGLGAFGTVAAFVGQNPSWAVAGVLLGLIGLMVLAGSRLQNRVDDLDKSKIDVDAVFLPDDQMARLVVANDGGVRATFEARVADINGAAEIFDVSWGDKAEKQSTIAPGSKGFVNVALFGQHDGQLTVCPIRVGKTDKVIETEAGEQTIEEYDAHNPRFVTGNQPIRFTIVVSSEEHPNETDRVITLVGYDQPKGGGKYHRLESLEHLVGGKSVN